MRLGLCGKSTQTTDRESDVSRATTAPPATAPTRHEPGGADGATPLTPPPLPGAPGADAGSPPRVVRPSHPGTRRPHPVALGRGHRAAGLADRARHPAEGDTRRPVVPHDPTPTALPAGVGAGGRVRLLGVFLAAGLRPCLAAGGAVAVRLRLRHAAVVVAPRQLCSRLRAVPDHLQHEPVSLVPRRLVLPAVPHVGRRVHG